MEATESCPSLSPATLVRLGMSRQPFVDKVGERFFLDDPGYNTQINVVLNMLQSSDKTMLIKGPRGVGKTTFIERLRRSELNTLSFCLINAAPGITADALCRTALKILQLSPPPVGTDILEYFGKRIASRRRIEGKTILMIDDAHHLDVATIDQLMSLRRVVSEDGISAISLVFSGDATFEEKLNAIPRIAAHPSIIYHVSIHPFTEEQTRKYLAQRFQRCGSTSDTPFLPDQQVTMIFHRSKGIAERIHIEVCQLLEKPSSKNKLTASGKSGRRPFPFLATGIILLGGIVLVALYFERTYLPSEPAAPLDSQPSQTQQRSFPRELTLPEAQTTTLDANPAEFDPLYAESGSSLDTASSRTDSTQNKTATDPITGLPVDVESKPAVAEGVQTAGEGQHLDAHTSLSQHPAKSPSEQTTQENPAPAQPEKLRSEPSDFDHQATAPTSPVAPVAPVPPVDSMAPTAPESAPSSTTALSSQAPDTPVSPAVPDVSIAAKTEAPLSPAKTLSPPPNEKTEFQAKPIPPSTDNALWVKNQPARFYTMQLVASQDQKIIDRFLTRAPALKDYHVVETVREDVTWIIVITGSYADRNSALSAVKTLPDKLQTPSPWIRTFGSIQSILPD